MQALYTARRAYRRTRNFVVDNKRHLPIAALVAGFVWDSLTLNRPDQVFDNAVIIFYLLVVAGTVAFMNRQEERGVGYSLWWLAVLQFSFGNLASGLFVIFGRSGTLVGSWPFLLVFLALLIGNEFLKGQYTRLRFNIAIFYLFLLSYLVLVVPVLVRAVGTEIFLVSGLASIALIGLFLWLFYLVAPKRISENRRQLLSVVAAVFLGFNTFYFFNLIPPVPLALKDIGIYHHVSRTSESSYQVSYEAGRWYQPFKRSDSTFHLGTSQTAFCFSSVFAPARISTPIYHRWEYYDEVTKKWITIAHISFPITGGRDDGFRGFSTTNNLRAGEWRCSVETQRGELIGRRNFTVAEGGDDISLETGFR